MQDDPAIERVREVRHRISQQCEHDPKKLVEYYMRLQERYRERLLKAAQAEKPEARTEEVTAEA
jgi:hypothetical protein